MTQNLNDVAGKMVQNLLNPLLGLLFAAGTLVFAYGIVEFLWGLSTGSTDKQNNGKQHIGWGLVGMFVMVAAWAIVRLIGSTVQNPVSGFGFN